MPKTKSVIDVPGCVSTLARIVPSEYVATLLAAMPSGMNTQPIQDNFGSSYKDGEINLTLVKTATYCAHPVPNRPLLRDGIFIGKVDQGQRDFNFRLTVAKENELKRNADEFTEKPYALNVFPTIDEKDDNGFKISSENADISFVTLKKARQVNGYVMRLQNNSEKPARDCVKFGDKTLGLDFGKYEVKTVVYDGKNLYEIKDMII